MAGQWRPSGILTARSRATSVAKVNGANGPTCRRACGGKFPGLYRLTSLSRRKAALLGPVLTGRPTCHLRACLAALERSQITRGRPALEMLYESAADVAGAGGCGQRRNRKCDEGAGRGKVRER
jgi:hypothetical protein